MMKTPDSDNHTLLLPEASHGTQLNHCKTVSCKHFGSTDTSHYVLQRSNPKKPILVCRECGAFPPLVNNHDVGAEVTRLQQQQRCGLPACNNAECENLGLPVLTHRHLYHAFGYSGDRQRYRCKCCQATFVDRWSGFNNKNQLQQKLLAMLFTGYSVRDICRRLNMNPKSFYDHLSHIASRCRRQLTIFDARLFKQAESLELASNIRPLQPKSDNGVLWMASCEAQTGYVVAQDINYQQTAETQGTEQHDPYVNGTRFMSVPIEKQVETNTAPLQGLLAQIDTKYRDMMSRPNLEDPLTSMPRINYPAKGCLIRPQYTVYAHYLHLRGMLENNRSLSIYMQQETLLRSACISIFVDHIKDKTIHPIYVEYDPHWQHNQPVGRIDIVLMGWWRDRWAFTRHNSISKGICHLGGEKDNEGYWLEHASHDAITEYQQRFHDQFSQLVNEPRRKLRPGGLLPLLDIYRAWNNLCHQDRNGQTPAQKVGLITSPLTLEQLLS
ncbi:lactate dehydrogenase [Photobacterium makurazakiensis]|uniref:transposase n=1 Tax=Photobacterium makurazakiensis TaxID=2910234 RepID=UPI003D0CC3CA